MNKPITIICALIALCAGAMQAQTKDYSLRIGDFSELTVSANINVEYKASTDSAGLAVYSCHPEVAHAITFTCNKGKVKIEVISDNPLTKPLPTVTVYSSTLSKANNMGDSTLVLASTQACEKLSLKIVGNGVIKAYDVYTTKLSANVEAGSGHIYVSGKAQEANYNVAGAGVIEGGQLSAQKVKAWMLGTGSIDCEASETLSLYGAGSGTVYYKGKPRIKKRNVGVKLVAVE